MIFTLALRIRIFSRWFIVLLLLPILAAAVSPILAGQAQDASKTLLVQIFTTPADRPFVLLLALPFVLALVIELLASIEEQRSGSKDLRKYLKELVRTHELLAPDGFFQQSVLGIVGVPLEAVFIHLQAVTDRPRFDVPDEHRELLAAIQRRTDLPPAQQEELIQALRVRWYSQVGRISPELPEKVAAEQLLQSATSRQPGTVLLGAPGSGKSTTLRWLILQMARAACLPWYRHWIALLLRLLKSPFETCFSPEQGSPSRPGPLANSCVPESQ